ncbi:hypothetical protein A2U01_0059477 [Trifolium medium]|uniref:Uncharacterized protein n=1 Tax=Trifolium medium TaxID=97028 RepID=A0A392RPK6_9FABA|nr:hypothetical protein [Trifolium medium]
MAVVFWRPTVAPDKFSGDCGGPAAELRRRSDSHWAELWPELF